MHDLILWGLGGVSGACLAYVYCSRSIHKEYAALEKRLVAAEVMRARQTVKPVGTITAEEGSEPYFIEVDNNGCSQCGAGRTYTVIGPDGYGGGISYDNDEDAEAMADALNDAFYKSMANEEGM